MNDLGMSLSDIAAVTKNDGNWENGGWLWFIVVLFAIFGNGFGGFGGNNVVANYATQADITRGFADQNTQMSLNSISQMLGNSSYENARLINQGMLDASNGFNQTQMAIMNSANNIVNSQTNGFNSVNSGICDLGFQVQNVGCSINRNIDSVKFENAQNTCAITNAIHQEGELTRGLIQANTVQDLRDRLEEKDRLYQAANFQISQAAQTNNIINQLKPYPVPAYITSSPYTSYPYYGTTTV